MAKNINEIPYTEIVERIQSLSRAPDNSVEKIRGLVQDIYLREIPDKYDWNFLFVSTSTVCREEYKTGTVSINTGTTTANFSTDATIPDTNNSVAGRQIKINGASTVYRITYVTDSRGTLFPTFQETGNATNQSYTIFEAFYGLPVDFDRFPKDGGFHKWIGGKKEIIPEADYQKWTADYSSSPSVPKMMRFVEMNKVGQQIFEVNPPPQKRLIYGVDYLKKLNPLIELTSGLIQSISAGATQVDGLSGTLFADAQTGDWLRIDALGRGQDSQWYRINSISSDVSLSLSTAFANTAVTSANYTISRAPDMPVRLHPALIYGALRSMEVDQNDPNAMIYQTKFAEILSDSKRIYVSRNYSKDFQTIAEEYRYRY